ncbi:SPOR domain-containing protein [Massilia niastensis]|uniref:SPOR domain-containing protein n=1 Tax=Massilia niastensis TaxID=544911 RepID=UPI00036DB0E8|nr:SPOR domain-containing protein [Massilia niastensis]
MGLFSFGKKNKQETVRDSGHFVKDDDAAFTERARSKRASSAGEGGRRGSRGPDPVLPEKKRARRRLVGAVALALAAAVGLPMLLDSEPKPLAGDIAINIPSKEKAAPLPVPAEPVPAAATVDSGEEIIEPPPGPAPKTVEPPPLKMADQPPLKTLEPASVRTVETTRQEAPRPAPAKPEPKPEPKPAPKHELAKAEPRKEPEKREPEKREPEKKPAVKLAEAKPVEKPVHAEPKPVRADDSARAMAILEDKPSAQAQGPAPKYVVQVAALASQEKVSELQGRLRAAGVSSFTQKSGELIRVRVGPMTKEEAEKVRAKLGGIGLSGTMVPL